ncbi:MAG: HAMP domain-containing protein, partial [Clostridia bacterium]
TNVTTEIRARETQNAEQSLQRVYSSLVAQFSGVVSLSNAIASDVKLSGLLDRDYRSPIGYYSAYFSSIHPQVNRYLYAYSQYINGIQFYSNNPTLANGGDCLRITEEVRRADWFPISGEATLLCYLRKQVGQTNALQLCISRALDDRAMRHELVLRIDLNMEPIYKLVEQESAFLSVYLVMPDGAAICYPGAMQDRAVIRHELPLPSSAELRVSFGDHTAMKNWRLFAVINSAPMEASIREAIWVGLLIGLVCSLFAGALSLIFARSIILRSNRLLRHMDSMTAEHFSPIDCDVGRDEIGELIKHFNAMGTRLKQLINDLYVLQLHQKSLELENVRAELKYLQAQIDPHFLFN